MTDVIADPVRSFRFESYGVKVEITSNDPDMVAEAAEIARVSLLGNVKPIRSSKVDHVFDLSRTNSGLMRMVHNQEQVTSGRSRRKFFKFFDSMIRVAVGEYAVDRVFLHAGVVSWKGKAIVIPADSYKGKTTLVAELVRNGAVYYSDEFAIFDAKGMVHPFARPLAMRNREGKYREYKLTPEMLGGTSGSEPVPVGLVLLTAYVSGKSWSPKMLSRAEGVMAMMPYTLCLRRRPDFSVRVLNNVASHAIIATSLRGTAEKFAKTLLDFVDKQRD